jgi:hypothetical protein
LLFFHLPLFSSPWSLFFLLHLPSTKKKTSTPVLRVLRFALPHTLGQVELLPTHSHTLSLCGASSAPQVRRELIVRSRMMSFWVAGSAVFGGRSPGLARKETCSPFG